MTNLILSKFWLNKANSKFLNYSKILIDQLRYLTHSRSLNPWALSFIEDMLCTTNSCLQQSLAPLEVTHQYTRVWNKDEYKILSIHHSLILNNDEFYWLKLMPGLKLKSNSMSKFYYAELPSKFLHKYSETKVSSIISHNGHFGHFIGDDLARWIILRCFNKDVYPAAMGFKDNLYNILEELDLLDNQEINASNDPLCINKCTNPLTQFFQCSNLVDIKMPPRAYSIFLSMLYIKEYFASANCQIPKKGKVFLRRENQFQSRIANIDEFSNFLITKGFEILDPGQLCMKELYNELSGRSCVISETGTIALMSNVCTSPSCLHIILMPEILLLNPDPGMLISGLPYMLAGYSQKEVLYGKVVVNHPVQSSIIAHYCTKELGILLGGN